MNEAHAHTYSWGREREEGGRKRERDVLVSLKNLWRTAEEISAEYSETLHLGHTHCPSRLISSDITTAICFQIKLDLLIKGMGSLKHSVYLNYAPSPWLQNGCIQHISAVSDQRWKVFFKLKDDISSIQDVYEWKLNLSWYSLVTFSGKSTWQKAVLLRPPPRWTVLLRPPSQNGKCCSTSITKMTVGTEISYYNGLSVRNVAFPESIHAKTKSVEGFFASIKAELWQLHLFSTRMANKCIPLKLPTTLKQCNKFWSTNAKALDSALVHNVQLIIRQEAYRERQATVFEAFQLPKWNFWVTIT